jgi:hypothetical protein
MTVVPAISNVSSAQDDAPAKGLSIHDWAALPLQTRMSCLLFDALTALNDIWGDLQTEEGNTFRWLEPHLLDLSDKMQKTMERLAS